MTRYKDTTIIVVAVIVAIVAVVAVFGRYGFGYASADGDRLEFRPAEAPSMLE